MAPGPDAPKRLAEDFRSAFPDLTFHIDFITVEGDTVVVRSTLGGTQTGRRGNVPPTGKHAEIAIVNIFRIADGKIVKIGNHRDDLALIQQLGIPFWAGRTKSTERGTEQVSRAPR